MCCDILLNYEKTDTRGGHRICYHSRWRSNTEFVLSAWNMTYNKITFKHTSIVLGVPSETFLMELPASCYIQCANMTIDKSHGHVSPLHIQDYVPPLHWPIVSWVSWIPVVHVCPVHLTVRVLFCRQWGARVWFTVLQVPTCLLLVWHVVLLYLLSWRWPFHDPCCCFTNTYSFVLAWRIY